MYKTHSRTTRDALGDGRGVDRDDVATAVQQQLAAGRRARGDAERLPAPRGDVARHDRQHAETNVTRDRARGDAERLRAHPEVTRRANDRQCAENDGTSYHEQTAA